MRGKYLYCVTKENKNYNFNNLVGIENMPIGAVNHQGLCCIVSEINSNYKELDKESAVAHEKVLEQVMNRGTIIPIAFGHIVKSEEEIKDKLLKPYQQKLEDWLTRLNGKIELSLKAFWLDLKPVLSQIAQNSSEIQRIRAKGGVVSRNDQIRAGEIASKLMGKKRENFESGIINHLKDITQEHKKCNLFSDQMITNLAFLLPAQNINLFDKKINEYSDNLNDNNVKLKYTGPVPPYNFVDFKINLT